MVCFRTLGGALLGALIVTGTASAQSNWPTRSVLVVSPFTAGNASDLIGRITLEQVSTQLNQPFVLENRPGGGGRSPPSLHSSSIPDTARTGSS